MTVMQASLVSTTTVTANIALIQGAQDQCKKASASSFDALLQMVDLSNDAIVKAASGSTSQAADGTSGASGASFASSIFSVFMSENSADGGFGFSDDFLSTFGGKGPLIDWINTITTSLHLTKEQNSALQGIAVKHKDTGTGADDVAQIGEELRAAGIG